MDATVVTAPWGALDVEEEESEEESEEEGMGNLVLSIFFGDLIDVSSPSLLAFLVSCLSFPLIVCLQKRTRSRRRTRAGK